LSNTDHTPSIPPPKKTKQKPNKKQTKKQKTKAKTIMVNPSVREEYLFSTPVSEQWSINIP
jgi:hypothetical protein